MKNFDSSNQSDKIEIKKKISQLRLESRKNAKPDKCILCGEKLTSFCNSHSVPKLSLKNIAYNGMVLHASALMKIDIVDIESGINNSGTFHFICRNCDGSFFQDYENEQNLKSVPTDRILAEIAVKNFLLQLSKRTQEKSLYKNIQQQYNIYNNFKNFVDIHNLDIRDFKEEIDFHKNILDHNEKNGYQILFWKVVPYKVPIAIQSAIVLTKDLEGNKVNNIFDMSASVRMQFMHLVVLPLRDVSVILAFYHKRDKLYRELRHQINRSSEDKVLQFLNYIIFAYTENYFISKTIQKSIETDKKLSLLAREYNENPNLGLLGKNNFWGFGYNPVGMNEIPNFLSAEWAID